MKKFFKFGCLGFIGLIVLFIIIGMLASGGDDTTPSNTASNTKSTETNKEKTAEKKEDPNKIKAGTYKVGTDLEAGEYLIFAEGMSYFESAKDSTGQLDSIIFNGNLKGGAHSYVTLQDGEYFKLQRGHMYPVASAPSIVPENGLYEEGMYKVGQDIPAGEYKVTLTSGMGYLEVSSNSRHDLGSIINNENVQADTYITVSDGQYLKLQGVNIQK